MESAVVFLQVRCNKQKLNEDLQMIGRRDSFLSGSRSGLGYFFLPNRCNLNSRAINTCYNEQETLLFLYSRTRVFVLQSYGFTLSVMEADEKQKLAFTIKSLHWSNCKGCNLNSRAINACYNEQETLLCLYSRTRFFVLQSYGSTLSVMESDEKQKWAFTIKSLHWSTCKGLRILR